LCIEVVPKKWSTRARQVRGFGDRDTIAVIEPRPYFAAKRLDRQIAHSRCDPTKHWPMNLPANSSWRAVAATSGRAHLFEAREAYSHWGSLA
jgi:hypothetical protein